MNDPNNVDEELQILRALRDSLIAEREAIETLTPAQQEKFFARIDHILEPIGKLERLKRQRAAILKSMKSQ